MSSIGRRATESSVPRFHGGFIGREIATVGALLMNLMERFDGLCGLLAKHTACSSIFIG